MGKKVLLIATSLFVLGFHVQVQANANSEKTKEHPKAFAPYKNKLIIAHGQLGVSFFELTTKKVTRAFPVALSKRPLESVVNGITVSGRYALAALDRRVLMLD